MTRLLIADVSVLADPGLFGALYANASVERRAAADRFRFESDRRLSIGASALLDIALKESPVGDGIILAEKEVHYGHNEFGKPCFIEAPQLHFSISHSGSTAAVAFSDRETGCDIEEIPHFENEVGSKDKADEYTAIARRFFSPDEYALLMDSKAPGERIRSFLRIWTLKESYMKATGRGMSMKPEGFSVLELPSSEWTLLSPGCGEGVACAICGRPGIVIDEIRRIDLAQQSRG